MRLIRLAAIAAAIAPGVAQAEQIRPLLDARLRWETVDQDGIAREADAATLRLRAGAEWAVSDWALLAEGEATAAPRERYDSGVNGRIQYPLVADPENIELNRLHVQYRGVPKTLTSAMRHLAKG